MCYLFGSFLPRMFKNKGLIHTAGFAPKNSTWTQMMTPGISIKVCNVFALSNKINPIDMCIMSWSNQN